jgi:hypothetical protein
MVEKSMSLQAAYAFVKARRKNARPNIGFLMQLVEFEKQLLLDSVGCEAALGGQEKGGENDASLPSMALSIPAELLEAMDEKKIYDFLNAALTQGAANKTGKK